MTVSRSSVSAIVSANGSVRWSEEFSWHSTEELRDVMLRASTESKPFRNWSQVRIELAAELLQQRSLSDLPPVSAVALQEMVARGTSRYFRQNGHHLVSGAAWEQPGADAARSAIAVAADGPMIDALLVACVEGGLTIEDIVPAAGLPAVSLLPGDERRRRDRGEWKRTALVAALAVVVWLIALGAVAGQRLLQLRATSAELSELRDSRDALLAARLAMDSASAMVSATTNAERHRQSVVQLMAQVTGALPDSAYLEEITLSADGSGTISGRARQPAAVLQRLQRVKRFAQSSMRITAQPSDEEPGRGWSGFTIQLSRVQ